METVQRRGEHLDGVSDDEEVAPNPNLEPVEDQDEERLLRVLTRAHSKPVVEVGPYGGKLGISIVLDWILDIEKLFEYENTPNNRKMKIFATKLKGHASLWWEHLQIDGHRQGKENIRTWIKMVTKIKNKFLTIDYQVILLRKMKNLR